MRISSLIEFEEYGYMDGKSFYYFIAPKEQLESFGLDYEDADLCTLYLEHPFADKSNVTARISPTKFIEEEDCYADYDWNDIELTYEEVQRLIAVANKGML